MTAGRAPLARPFLYAILDADHLAGRRPGEVAGALVRGGARLVQVRAKDLDDRARIALAREVIAACRPAGVPVLVNDRPDLARVAGADGVHVGQEDLVPADARRVLGARALVGVSTHDAAQLERALREPVDYVAVGPVFPTSTKRDPDPVVGLRFVREAAARAGALPVVAIGGITRANAGQVVAAGAAGVAVIGDLLGSADVEASARALVAALDP